MMHGCWLLADPDVRHGDFRGWRACLVAVLAVGLVCGPHGSPWARGAEMTAEQQKQVDHSIKSALHYLATHQQANGAWRSDQYGEMTSMTSLAIMAFMAAGHVPGEGPYGEQMLKGIRWVIQQQKPNGLLVKQASHGPMYCHGISTLMLAEVLGMVPAEDAEPVRKTLEKAIRLILDAQNVAKARAHAGGWRYLPNSTDSDLSVTGWQLLALRAAKNSGCDVPAENIDRAVAYVVACSVPGHKGFAYQPHHGASAVRTGTGILALEICGEHHLPQTLGGAEILLRNRLQYHDSYFFYGAYYCSVGMFQVGGKHWDATRDSIYLQLLAKQNLDGSWTAGNGSERNVGKIYSTSMAVLALAVEYQYLPIYQR